MPGPRCRHPRLSLSRGCCSALGQALAHIPISLSLPSPGSPGSRRSSPPGNAAAARPGRRGPAVRVGAGVPAVTQGPCCHPGSMLSPGSLLSPGSMLSPWSLLSPGPCYHPGSLQSPGSLLSPRVLAIIGVPAVTGVPVVTASLLSPGSLLSPRSLLSPGPCYHGRAERGSVRAGGARLSGPARGRGPGYK